MTLAIYIPPYAEPVHLAEMRLHMKQDSDAVVDDSLISGLTTAARLVIEGATGANVERYRAMLATTFDYSMDGFPGWSRGSHRGCHDLCGWRNVGHIHLPVTPIIAVTSISYVDNAGSTQALSASAYSVVNANMGIIALNYNQYWPSTRWQPNGVTVRFTSGMAASFTAATSDVCTVYGRTFADDDRVQLRNSGGTLPAGLNSGVTYFVRDSTGSTFKLALTSGGTAIDITDAGSGTHFAGLDMSAFEALRSAVKLECTRNYKNRGDGFADPGATDLTQRAIDSLVGVAHA